MSTPNEPQNPYGEQPQNPEDPFRKADPSPEPPAAPQYGAPGYGAPQAPQYGAPQYPGTPQYPGGPQYPAAPPYQGGYGPTPPPNYLVWAILTTVLCCLPLGIASIVFSSQVNSKFAQGDYAGAASSSNKAKQFAMWSAIVGGVFIVIAFIAGIAGGFSENSNY
ncbi:CD225/dispanin family protein [Cellulomonas rhizosphaerae]|uniref:CD225/dispanin family protein n=1 Tax=Cellulomonas rhizosphaerae TaxID=2293719 RepID=A0A413RHZ0_9CELL|nr:CD225/dispanin family protein [Cellulomonas rhizosphaerae]RHA37864.1 CD225/dispanin family protein [Cellulomonas rhizosphaerae]